MVKAAPATCWYLPTLVVNKPALSQSSPDNEAYIQMLELRLKEKQVRLEHIKRQIQTAIERKRINGSDQLHNAERLAESCLSAMQQQLGNLKAASNADWDKSKMNSEIAWEELSQSVKNLVARFS